MKKFQRLKNVNFFLLPGKDNEEQIILNEILESKFKDLCIPLDNFSIKETLPIIKSCNLSICNDSSFSHLICSPRYKNYNFNGRYSFSLWKL